MTKKSSVLSAVSVCLLVFPLVPQEQGALSPEGTYRKAIEKIQQQDGYHLSLQMRLLMGEGAEPIKVRSKGTWKKPDFTYMVTEGLGGFTTEYYQKGDRVAQKNPATGEWEEMEGGVPGFGRNLQDPVSLLKVFEADIQESKFGKDRTLRGKLCKTISVKPKPSTLQKLTEAFGTPAGLDIQNAKMKVTIALGKEDLLVHQIRADVEIEIPGMGVPPGDLTDDDLFGDEEGEGEGDDPEEFPPMKVKLSLTINIFDYNKNLNAEIPKEVKALLETPPRED